MLVAGLIAGAREPCSVTPRTTRAAFAAAAAAIQCELPVKGSAKLVYKGGSSLITSALHQWTFYSSVYVAEGVAWEPVCQLIV
jgi:hypothetical protein